MHKRSRKALTLIELVISMAVASIIGLTVLVSLSILDRRNLESAARSLVSNLNWTREMAISNGVDYIVTFDMANNSYAIYEDIDGDSVADAGEKKEEIPLRTIDLTSMTDFLLTAIAPEILVFRKPDPSNTSIIVDSSGNPMSALITLTYASKTKVVRIFSRSGYMRLD